MNWRLIGGVAAFVIWVGGFEAATALRRRAGYQGPINIPGWTRLSTVLVVALCFVLRPPFPVALGAAATTVLATQALMWLITRRLAANTDRPSAYWGAAAVETGAIVLGAASALATRFLL